MNTRLSFFIFIAGLSVLIASCMHNSRLKLVIESPANYKENALSKYSLGQGGDFPHNLLSMIT